MNTLELTAPASKEVAIPVDVDQLDTAKPLTEIFQPFQATLEKWEAKAKSLVVTDISQKTEMEQARLARLELKEARCNMERTRKGLVEGLKARTTKIDTAARTIRTKLEALEEELRASEEFAERHAEKVKAELKAKREAELAPFLDAPVVTDLSTLSEDDFAKVLNDAKLLRQAKLDAAAKAEADRKAKEEADRIERERIAAENARLKAEAEKAAEEARKAQEEAKRSAAAAEAERKRVEAEREGERRKAKAEADRIAAEAEAERKRVEAAHAAERKKAEAENARLAEIARKEKAVAEAEAKKAAQEQARLKAELEAREKAEAERKAKYEAEQKAITADFETWWHNEGSGMAPKKGEDAETHVRRVAEIAWKNGAYKAHGKTQATQPSML